MGLPLGTSPGAGEQKVKGGSLEAPRKHNSEAAPALMRILLLTLVARAALGTKLGIDFSTDEAFSITIDGTPWLFGGGASLGQQRLRPSGPWRAIKGKDARGRYKGRARRYGALDASYAAYADAVVFTQRFPDGATVSPRGVDGLASEWPALGPGAHQLGVLTFGGRFMETSRATKWTGAGSVESGAYGGPFVLFDGESNALVVSAATEFAAHSTAPSTQNASAVAFGVLGSVANIPRGFAVATVLTLGQEGITSAVRTHGQALLAGTVRPPDYATRYLGYSTDNGAYYYYNPDQDYGTTLRAVRAYAQRERIPYRYALLDSWWYEKGSGDGVRNWSCTTQAFPQGCQGLSEELDWRFMLHNREWSADNVYRGAYEFAVEPPLALPLEQRFWDDLLQNGSDWGMIVYEQDWLYTEFLGLNATLQSSATGAKKWLTQMATAAARVGVTVQYCMELCGNQI
jgi:hypothetical protein